MLEYRMRIAVCDDNADDLRLISEETEKILSSENIACEVVCFENGKALLSAIENGEEFHVLFLDVLMDGVNGIELASMLRSRENHATIVFISHNREMALCGYEVGAARYLAKPVSEEKLREALLYCYRTGQSEKDIFLPTANGMRRLSPNDIMYIETWGRGVRVVLVDGQEEVGMKISDLAGLLTGKQFVLCHRTVLVNLAFVKYLRYCELEMKTGAVLPVSKYRQNATREKLMNYLED